MPASLTRYSIKLHCKLSVWYQPRSLLQVASNIRDAGGEATSVPGDVTAEDFAAKIIKATIDKYGALHILINNAGESHVSDVCICTALQGSLRACFMLHHNLLALASQPIPSHEKVLATP